MSYQLVTEGQTLTDGYQGVEEEEEEALLSSWGNGTQPEVPYEFRARIVTLWILFALGGLGNLLVFAWLRLFRRRKSRLQTIVFAISLADMCVCIFNVLISAVMEMQGARWYVGNAMCKLVMFMQSVSLMASSNCVVLLAVDRHQAVRNPLKTGCSLRSGLAVCWGCALAFSTPQLFIWNEKGSGAAKTCSTAFPEPVSSWKVAYITYAAFLSFLVPFVVITVAYIRITTKIWLRATRSGFSQSIKTTTVYSNGDRMDLRVTSSALLNKAKNKTLTMSTVIILVFMTCSLPYFIVEIIRCYNSGFRVDQNVYAVLGTFAVSNSAVNPYIFLVFNLGSRSRLSRERTSTT